MSIAAVSSTSADSLATQAKEAQGASDRFLKLLVAQMQNQDPLNPMDNAQVTSQMAQINTVSGIEKLNLAVQELSSQFVQMQALQGAGLVGRDVIVPGNRVDIEEGVGQGGFELASAADQVKVEILSGAGTVLETIALGAQSAGLHSFDWVAAGHADAENLRFRVSATSGSVATGATPLMRDTVDAVSTSGSGFRLELTHSGSAAYSAVRAFN